MAFAPPIRPPFFKFSKVSSVAKILVLLANPSTKETISSIDFPAFAADAALRMMVPKPDVIDLESIHFTVIVSTGASAAS